MNYRKIAINILTWLDDLIFPMHCLGCGSFHTSGELPYLCHGCLRKIPVRGSGECIGCKTASPLGETCVLCRPKWALDRLLVASDYGHLLVSRLIKTVKFKFVRDASLGLLAILLLYIRKLASKKTLPPFSENSLVTPVPLFYRRLNWRGFNQAELLARSIANKILLEPDTTCLIKVRATTPQTEKGDRDSRFSNLTGAFLVKYPEKISGRHVLLIDDVCTTGATLNECAKVLKSAGAKTVNALVVARDSYKTL